MLNSRHHRSLIIIGAILLLGIALLSPISIQLLQAAESDQSDIQTVWQRVHQSGAYNFSAQVTQTLTPQSTVANAGRSEKETTLFLEGQTDLAADSLILSLWSNGGSVLAPESGVQIKVEGDKAYSRQGDGEWKETDNFTGLFAPGGDFLAYVRSADNVIRHAPERLSTVAGDVLVTRYSFDINGRHLAEQVREQMMAEATGDGLPPNVAIELPRTYVDMTGQGELWVGEDGLPLRQKFELQFPERADNYLPTAHATVDFSDFNPLPPATFSGQAIGMVTTVAKTASSPETTLPITAATLALVLAAALIIHRRSRRVYATVALSVVLAMVVAPLLNSNRVVAYSVRQEERQTQEQAKTDGREAQAELEAELLKPSFDPNADPLMRVQGQLELAASNDLMASNDLAASNSNSKYFDPVCESDPEGDIDSDQLTNLQECILGTLPEVADTDGDNLNDGVEVAGVVLTGIDGVNRTWYTDPLQQDSNIDGISDGREWLMDANNDGSPDDSDGDGEPDMWDQDNDGDGVPDDLDLSPYSNTKDATAFSGDNPFQLVVDGLQSNELVKVEFQLSPTEADHLWYTQNVLDWPDDDLQGPIQDSDGATFFDVDPTLSANPNDNGDMRLIPMMEIEITGSPDNLPSQDILSDFGISIQETAENVQTAYVPLQLVTDGTGEKNVAFYGRMFYQPTAAWGDAQPVRLVWLVQALTDQCESYENNICSSYSTLNDLQVIQSYDDDWFLTGFHVTEEHSADMDIIVEDPIATAAIVADYDKPFYMDTLYGLLYGLDNTFLAGSDCDSIDGTGECVGDGQRDINVTEITRRFNHETNGGVSDEERWNLPNVLDVQQKSYESIDLAMMDTTITQTVQILDSTFTSAWSASEPITPTIMYAYEQTYRSLNLDETLTGSGNLNWAGNNLAVNMPSSGADAVEVQTMASVKWAPYAYDSATGWDMADLQDYYDDLSAQLGSSFDHVTDPQEADTYQTMAQLLYVTIYSGDNNIVQIGDIDLNADYEQADQTLAVTLAVDAGRILRTTMSSYYTYSTQLAQIAETIEASGDEATASAVVSQFIYQETYKYFTTASGAAQLAFVAVIAIVAAVALFATYVLHDTSAAWSITAAVSVGILTTIFSVVKPIQKTVSLVQALVELGEETTVASALFTTLTSSSELIKSSRAAGLVGLVIAIAISIGIFLYVVGSGKVHAGTIAFNGLIAATIAAIIVAVLFYVLSLSLVGSILVGIIAVIDIILLLLGTGWSITGWLTTAIAGVIYQFKLLEDVDVQAGDLNMTLVDENAGLLAGNQMAYDLPITTTLSSKSGKIASNSLIYDLSENEKKLSTKIGDRVSEWTLSEGAKKHHATVVDTPALTAMLSAGVNTRTPLVLNSAYALLGQSCWVGFCTSKTIKGASSDDLGVAIVLDVLPATLTEFVDVTAWAGGEVRFADADGDGLLPFDEGGVDPDPTTWDADGDNLADDYELTIRGKTSAEGGEDLDPLLADTDGDTIPDDEELRLGANPGNADTDGDGLSDVAEIAPAGGWFLAYASDKFTRVWSDPLQADNDGDGMSDLFERTQDTCPDCAPWADPANPLVYSPNVWNESPVALYVGNDTSNDIVQPGATIIYTTTTANNLSNAQSLVGELALELPAGFSGAPLAAGVDVESGNSESLVSQLTVDTAQSGPYVLASTMDLTDLDATVWSWDPPQSTSAATVTNKANDPAIASVSGWSEPYVVVMNETVNTGYHSITGYATAADGAIGDAQTIASLPPAYLFTAPDIACDDAGVCLVVWGANVDLIDQAVIYAVRLQKGLKNPSLLTIWAAEVPGESVTAPVVASDGDDFMATWARSTSSGQPQLWVQAVNNDGSVTEDAQSLAAPAADLAGVTIEWDGIDYAAIWRNGANLHHADVSATGQVSGETIIGDGAGWPDADGGEQAPEMAFDHISQQALLLYRADVSGNAQLQARRLNVASVSAPIVLETDALLNSNGVKTALCEDPKNGGWVAAWALPGQDLIATQAVGPNGSLRGATEYVTSAADSGIALACSTPRPVMDLEFEELENATKFADSSGLGNDVTCQAAQCPRSGLGGKFGNGVLFDGVDNFLDSNAPIVELGKGDFTIGAWMKTDATGATREVAIMTKSDGDAIWEAGEKSFYLDDSGQPNFVGWGNDFIRSNVAVNDGLWHHVVVVWDYNGGGAGGVGRMYVDGVNATAGSTNYQAINSDNAGDTLKIARPNYGEAPNFFSGIMDEIEVHNRALTGAEVNDVFEAAVAIYDLNEVAGSTTFVNAANNGFDATCSGNSCPTMGVPGMVYTAAQFDGVDDFMQVEPIKRELASYVYDFEPGTGQGWNKTRTDIGTRNSNSTTFLGPFNVSDGNVTLNLGSLPTHDTIEVTFDLYILGAWEGNSTITGPHDWEWGYDGKKALRSNFSNIDPNAIGFYQLYPAQSWKLSGIKLYGNKDCTSGELLVTADIPHLGDTSMGNNNVGCYKKPTDTVAILYKDGAYGGNSWIVDPKRTAFPDIPNNDLSSVRVWSAANTPRSGALGDTLAATGFGSDNTVYRITKTLSGHTSASLKLYFKGLTGPQWGLDNVIVSVQSDGGSLPLTNASFTLSAWAQRAQSGRGDILLSQGAASNNKGLQFGFRTDDRFTCGFWNDDLNTSAAYTDTNWHHWACTYDAATKHRTIYRDGVQVAQDTASANYDGFGSTFIGKNLNDGWNFMGEIDEMAVWNEALTAEDIAELTAKIKVEDQSVMTALLPAADGSATVGLNTLTLRESTTVVGANTQTITRTITVDGDAPAITLLSPTNGDHVRGLGMLSISGEATDPTTSIEQVEVQMGGGAWEVAAGTESWTHLVANGALDEGVQTIAARATDAAGNVSATATNQIILDRTPPAVDVAETILRTWRDSQGRWQAPFSGSVSDPTVGGQAGSGVSALEVLLHNEDELAGNGWQQGELSGADSWSVDYILPGFGAEGNSIANPSGAYTLTVRATDGVNNRTPTTDYHTARVTLDGAGPVITLDSPLTTTIITTALTLSGQATDVSTVTAVEVNFTPAEQIAALSGSILHLPFDENGFTEYFPDQSGANNAAVCDGAQCPTTGQGGQRDQGVLFQSNQRLVLEGVDLVDSSFTLAAWAKRSQSGQFEALITQGTTERDRGLIFGFGDTDHFMCSFYSNDLDTDATYTDSDWHHWACTYDADTRQRTIYRDGEQVAQDTASANYAGSGTLFIGKRSDDSWQFEGTLDELTVHGRTLAAYEVANLYAYGQGVWESASISNDTNPIWSYTIPEGEAGLEGIFQINVRGTDSLGNVTPLSGQSVWRGEIDTRPPQLTYNTESDDNGSISSTKYECTSSDFNLDLDATCLPVAPATLPEYRSGDITQTTYDEVNLWYATAITDTTRLYSIDAVRVYSGTTDISMSLQTCDRYNHCTKATAQPTPAPLAPRGVEVVAPSHATVLTSLSPIVVAGDAHDDDGLHTLFVKINGHPALFKTWPDATETSAAWNFTWAPPDEGIYQFQPVLTDNEGMAPLQAVSAEPGESTASPVENRVLEGNPYIIYLPFVERPTIPQKIITGTSTILYVDIEPPTVEIEPTELSSQQALGERIVELKGFASDGVRLHRVDVRIGDGAWQRARLSHIGRWRLPLRMQHAPDGESFEITARAEDIAGRTATHTESVYIDIVKPAPGEIELAYVNSEGQQLPIKPGDWLSDAASLELTWTAATDGSGDVSYEIGFSPTIIPQPGDLTSYATPGTHSQSVAGTETLYAHMRLVDVVGNTRTVTLGPFHITSD
ncbi:MAG: hypothetical protein GY764_12270 [Halieaceae bacterium]|nr:hypothetical protein [Halieaceae bacterium]